MARQVSHNQRVGNWGEQQAAAYLRRLGYNVIGQNVRTPYGEIDLLARKDDLTVFVEVKARLSSTMGPPEVSITPRKQEHMTACAEHYAQENGIEHWQIDVIAIERLAGQARIVHFENVVS